MALCLTTAVVLWSDTARADDPPALVGRLGYMEGTVSFHATGQDQWSYAGINYPVTSGDSFWSQPEGRAEIQIGSSAVRMDNTTELDVLRLDSSITQLQLDHGTINYRVTQLQPGEAVEIETPHGAVSLMQPGTYRIEAGDDTHPAVVATLEGEARFIGPHSFLDVGAGEQATAIGDPASYTMAEAVTTSFDDWALRRDARERESQTVRYVSPEMTGYQDLDSYGAWQTVPQYGAVWVPASVPAGWAPYSVGHWAWVEPWGWTWVDSQPWGFAPFHYGRWTQVEGTWAWVPGQAVQRPVYAPALVAFFGGAALVGSIGWLPLGPNEVYYPPYHPSLRYVQNVNQGPVDRAGIGRITNNSLAGSNRTVNNYANDRAATVVPQQAFVNAQPVQRAALKGSNLLQGGAATDNLTAFKPTAIARVAAVPAGNRAAGSAQVAPGPSVEQQHAETQAIEHAGPRSLAVTGKQEGQALSPAQPARQAQQDAAVPPAGRVTAEPQTARIPQDHAAQDHVAEPRREEAVREPGVPAPGVPAPGPAIRPARLETPLRQQQLAASLASAHTPAPTAAAERAQPAPRPQVLEQAAVKSQPVQHTTPAPEAATFHPAQVERPKQSAPLNPTPQGWHRQPTAPAGGPAKPAEPPHDDKKEEPKK